MRGTESDVAGMISATSSMKTVSERSTVMPWDRERNGENTSIYIMIWSGSLDYEIISVITCVCNQLDSRDCNHLSAAGSWHVQGRIQLQRHLLHSDFVTCDCSFADSYSSKPSHNTPKWIQWQASYFESQFSTGISFPSKCRMRFDW